MLFEKTRRNLDIIIDEEDDLRASLMQGTVPSLSQRRLKLLHPPELARTGTTYQKFLRFLIVFRSLIDHQKLIGTRFLRENVLDGIDQYAVALIGRYGNRNSGMRHLRDVQHITLPTVRLRFSFLAAKIQRHAGRVGPTRFAHSSGAMARFEAGALRVSPSFMLNLC
jgi:hypothetical protein